MAEAPGEVAAVLDAMVAAGEAKLNEPGRVLVLPPLCEPSPASEVVNASSWIEEWLYTAEGCRLPLPELARRAEEQELTTEGFDVALASLAASGMLAQEGGAFVHRLACLPPVSPAGDPLERVAAYDEPGIRTFLAVHVSEIGCRVTPEGRAGVEAVAAQLAPLMGVGEADGPEALAAVRARVEEVLDNPGGAYEIDAATGDLVFRFCTPWPSTSCWEGPLCPPRPPCSWLLPGWTWPPRSRRRERRNRAGELRRTGGHGHAVEDAERDAVVGRCILPAQLVVQDVKDAAPDQRRGLCVSGMRKG